MLTGCTSADQRRCRDRHVGPEWLPRLAFPEIGAGLRLAWLLNDPVAEQAIAAAGNRVDEGAIGAERLADGGDVKMQGVFLDDCAGPDAVDEVVLVDELAARLDQNLQDLERAASDRNGDASRPQLAPVKIDFPRLRRVDGSWALLSHRGPRQSNNPQNFSVLTQGVDAPNQLKRPSRR